MASYGLRCEMFAGLGLALCLLFAPAPVGAQTPSPATGATPESDTARFVRYTRALEVSPDRADARELRQWLLKWAVESPDYTVTVCDLLDLDNVDERATPHAGEVLLQTMYGNAAFQIEHGADADELSKQVAAVESALRVYTAYVAQNAKTRMPHLDALIAKRDAGALRAYLSPMVQAKCKSATAGAAAEAAKPSSPPFLGGFLRESHVVYPLKLDGWEMLGEQRYDSQEAGASVRFQHAKDQAGWIDVFFYPVGVLSEAEIATMAGTERQSLIDAWGKAMPDPQGMPSVAALRVPAGARPPSDASRTDGIAAYAVDFAYTRDGKALSSAMVFAVHRMYAIKFRYSTEAAKMSRAQVRQALERFARQLLPRLEITSTGGCWSSPKKSLAKGGQDAQAPQYDGCAGAEPMHPDVKDGMRELRFEYRAADPAPANRPLRAGRSGAG
ncbi:hypothetical protein LVB77_14490 [Lysobacter sp. 5GHs7-4]|uniref:hypothetical protein n=1 Tax=Lysobacter sp. 5GHs7-4 TaxID=2904253 RepID=UPI001E30FF8E|nr:hypothetical protein [Lysobacter sp. 5GHs7-4]UHQ21874.1 hypothetical protein LVB77_14490 [Lysobacter sp. 5GHs7-4]